MYQIDLTLLRVRLVSNIRVYIRVRVPSLTAHSAQFLFILILVTAYLNSAHYFMMWNNTHSFILFFGIYFIQLRKQTQRIYPDFMVLGEVLAYGCIHPVLISSDFDDNL